MAEGTRVGMVIEVFWLTFLLVGAVANYLVIESPDVRHGAAAVTLMVMFFLPRKKGEV